MKILIAIKHIFWGWWLLLSSNAKADHLNSKRLPHCQSCPIRNKFLNVCNDCGCFLPAKRRVQDEACPQGKW
jgi:hypothetical protein